METSVPHSEERISHSLSRWMKRGTDVSLFFLITGLALRYGSELLIPESQETLKAGMDVLRTYSPVAGSDWLSVMLAHQTTVEGASRILLLLGVVALLILPGLRLVLSAILLNRAGEKTLARMAVLVTVLIGLSLWLGSWAHSH